MADPIDEFFDFLPVEERRGRESIIRSTGASRGRGRPRSVSVTPQAENLGETLRNINGTLENLNATISGFSQPQQNPQPQQQPQSQTQTPAKSLSLSFEEYQTYFSIINNINKYIAFQIKKADDIDIYNNFDEYIKTIEKLEPSFLARNSLVLNNIETYRRKLQQMRQIDNIDNIEDVIDFFNFLMLVQDKFEFEILPNIDPTIKKMEVLKNKTLQGTNNVIFTKFKSDKKTSYDEILGDYIRIDITKAIPSKLRFVEKDKLNPFHVKQGDKTFVFNNIGMAKNFCLVGGIQSDFINAKNNIDYDKKYKNTYYQSVIFR